MSKKPQFKLNIGLSSILLIFVVLCLVSFAVLSLVSANADNKLSQKMLERSSTYYDACNQFEEDCAKLYADLKECYTNSQDEQAYYETLSKTEDTYSYALSDLQSLEVTVQFLYPENMTQPLFTVISRRVVTDDMIEYDTHLNVIP
ncbi:MAG: hypothetical protein E7290_11490 [Lachnospiraceae bacterium]|nr:hypothetical protein [Lachnospiraceae bacterium]